MTSVIDQQDSKNKMKRILIYVAIGIWVTIGLTAFFMTIYCYRQGSTAFQTIFALILSIFCGPFYWVYYLVSRSYCKGGMQSYVAAPAPMMAPAPVAAAAPVVGGVASSRSKAKKH
jgi:hypothetical protein